MSKLRAQKVPQNDIIRQVKQVVDYNADLLIYGSEVTEAGFDLITEGGERISTDLTEKFYTREEGLNATSVPIASEDESGRMAIVSTPEAIKAEDDSKAMTALKTLQLILSLGIPRFEITNGTAGQSLILQIEEGGSITIVPGEPAVTLQSLLAKSTPAQKNAFLLALLEGVEPESDEQAEICKVVGRCSISTAVVTHRFRNPQHFEFVDNTIVVTPNLEPSYMGRYDVNDCTEFSGWFVDINNPNTATPVRIERDGVVTARINATRLRDDVRLYLIRENKLPASASFTVYGWVYTKQAADKDGQPHTFKAYGGTSQTIATTDGGISATVTCGAVVVNPPTVNNPPQIVGVYNDQTVRAAGDQLLDSIVGLFSDTDALTYSATMADGSPLMAGISFTPGQDKPFKVLAGFPNQQLDIKLIATDTAGQSTPKTFRLSVERPVVTDNPVTVVTRAFGGDMECIEGSGARVKIVNTLSNGATSNYTGGGTYRIIPFYPDQMTITTDANAVGVIATKETVTADVPVTLEFKFPDETVITGPFTVRNKVAATSPVTGYVIPDVIVLEGSQAVAQVYADHADGTRTEVTQANGSTFELIPLYPNGMSVSYGNTARALIQTAGNSVSADVDVVIRFTFGGGGTVEGKITVKNQANPTTENPTPDPTPFVEKFAMRVLSLANGEFDVQLLYKTNLAVGSQLEDSWIEFFTRQNQSPVFIPSQVVNNPGQFPEGYKDYNVVMSYFMPASLVQSHALQHIKVRKTGTTNLLLDTTFDVFGLSAGQTKQFYPL